MMWRRFKFGRVVCGFTIICYLVSNMRVQAASMSVAEFLEDLLTRGTYDKRVRPGVDSGKPTVVYVDMFVNTVSSVNEVAMDYAVNVYLRQTWMDSRLAYTEYNHTLSLNYNQFDRMWVPDLFIKNEKAGFFHQLTVPNRLLKISPEGEVLYSQRLSLTLDCVMILKKYPMDNQTCKLEFESYGYTTDDLIFKWKSEKSVQLNDNLQLPEFHVEDYGIGDCTVEYITGTFSCIYGEIYLFREFKYYLVQVYIPTILIVMLSWVAFWIDMHAVPARITLGLLTVLTMTTQSSGISQRLPRVSYVKAIDVWMTTCLAFVFGGLVEYSIVNVLARKEKDSKDNKGDKTENEKPKEAFNLMNNGENNTSTIPVYKESKSEGDIRHRVNESKTKIDIAAPPKKESCFRRLTNNKAMTVDVSSRALFPAAFLVFNIAYWLIYYV